MFLPSFRFFLFLPLCCHFPVVPPACGGHRGRRHSGSGGERGSLRLQRPLSPLTLFYLWTESLRTSCFPYPNRSAPPPHSMSALATPHRRAPSVRERAFRHCRHTHMCWCAALAAAEASSQSRQRRFLPHLLPQLSVRKLVCFFSV